MSNARSIKDLLLRRAVSRVYELQEILSEIYNGETETEELFKNLELINHELDELNRRLRSLNGK